MEKEKLLDKLYLIRDKLSNNKKCLISDIFFTILILSAMRFSNLFVFMIISMAVYLARYGEDIFQIDSRYNKLLTYIYIILPCYSLVYISTRVRKSDDIFLWIFFLILLTKISGYFFRNIFGGKLLSERLHKTKTLGEIVGSLGVAIVIGLVSSLFLKQKLIKFLIINVIADLIIHIQDILDHNMKEKSCFIECYNNIALISIFIWISIGTNMILII